MVACRRAPQNFPEGLAVSLPLRGLGVSRWRAFWYGQLSGMVEPLAGLIGCVGVSLAEVCARAACVPRCG